jgi:hypothetical protein
VMSRPVAGSWAAANYSPMAAAPFENDFSIASASSSGAVPEQTDPELLWAKKAATVQLAVDAALRRHGPGASLVYMPEGSLTVPVCSQCGAVGGRACRMPETFL